MNIYKKLGIGLLSVFVLVLVVNIGLNWWIALRLPKIINENNNSPYYVTYSDLDVSLLSGTIYTTGIVVVPKSSLETTKEKVGVYAKIKTVEVNHFNLWSLIFNDRIKARSIRISFPEIVVYKNAKDADKKDKKDSGKQKPFSEVVIVSSIFIDHGNVKILEAENTTLTVHNFEAKVDGIVVTDDVIDNKIPFAFEKYSFKYDSLFFQPSKFYTLRTRELTADNSTVKVNSVSYLPTMSREKYIQQIPLEKDLFTISAKSLAISDMDWGFVKEKFYFHSSSLIINSAFANVYRGKMPEDDFKKKPLYNKLLRDIPYDIRIDTLALQNSKVEYEEEKTFEKGAGKLTFSKLNLVARDISSGHNKTSVPDVKIGIRCIFMGISPMKLNWNFNPLDQSDGFTINGSIVNFPAENLTPFTKPYMNVTAEGNLDEIHFNFKGNDKMSAGKFGINYDDLKVTVFRPKEPKKKHKILSAIANLFVKNDTKEKVKNVDVSVERVPEKSFFNLLWISIADGLKKILV